MVVLERGDEPFNDGLVPVVATQGGVPVGGLNFENAVSDLEDRHVEGAAPEVEHEDRLVGALFVEAVGQGGRRRLVDDAQYLEPGNLTCLLGCRALGVVEVGRDGHNGLGDRGSEVSLGIALELLKDPGRDLLGGVVLVVYCLRPAGTDVALDRADGPIGIRDGLALGHLADQDLSVFGEGHYRRGGAGTLGVGDDYRVAAFQDGDHRVGGAQIDSYGLGHVVAPVSSSLFFFGGMAGCRGG